MANRRARVCPSFLQLFGRSDIVPQRVAYPRVLKKRGARVYLARAPGGTARSHGRTDTRVVEKSGTRRCLPLSMRWLLAVLPPSLCCTFFLLFLLSWSLEFGLFSRPPPALFSCIFFFHHVSSKLFFCTEGLFFV